MAARKTLPTFPLAHIGFSLWYARQFLPVPRMGFNMSFHTLIRPFLGHRFMRDVKDAGRPLYAWTVNAPRFMDWCLRQNKDGAVIDGVVTDDPARFLKLCERYEDELDGQARAVESAGLREALGDTMTLIVRHVVAKVFFMVRRHLQHKLDDLDIRAIQPKQE